MKLRDLMIRTVQTTTPDESATIALQRMLAYGIRHLPVMEEGRLVGMVSERDLLPAADAESRVRHAMTWQVETASPDDGARACSARMASLRVGCLPVLQDGRLCGIVTATDLLAHFGDEPDEGGVR